MAKHYENKFAGNTTRRGRYWNRFIDCASGEWTKTLPPGEDLAALRAGLGRDALTVPKMWPYYTVMPDGDSDLERHGRSTTHQNAEHAALALFGAHQQSKRTLMHRPGAGLGSALRVLSAHDKSSSSDAVDRRVAALVASSSVPTLTYRLRGLVIQLRDIEQPLDYDRLFHEIEQWHWPDGRQRVRTGWAQGYQRWEKSADTTTD
ncbi:type I-E CRISPR-associated protein Cse2/CasB [Nocardia salmonicida]|uniref:type I-E CRISPR-associated protein Cse2/CasB n=1 Tax=Nocardia salmonicida TaxID=53431 RepID=UPI0007A3D428|nr:type I-E CRISPR-associated protein Cse2/CasB [Nocardia salmonicida]